MTIHITVVPASTNAGKATIRELLDSSADVQVRGIYRDPSKTPEDFANNSNFTAVKGGVADSASLDFAGSDAVFYIPPPTFDGMDQGQWATESAYNVNTALVKANVQKLVLHSAVGASRNYGIGILRVNHITDRILKAAVPEVHIVKPGWYAEMFADALRTIKEDGRMETTFTPVGRPIPVVSVQEVAVWSSKTLLDTTSSPGIHEVKLFGPQLYSSLDIHSAVEEITGKKGELVAIEKENLTGWFATHVPECYAQEYADLIIAMLPGGRLEEEYEYTEETIRGEITLVEALRAVAEGTA